MTPTEKRALKTRIQARLGKQKAARREKRYGALGQCRGTIRVFVSHGTRGFQRGGWNAVPIQRRCQAKAGPSGYCSKCEAKRHGDAARTRRSHES